MLLYLHNSTKKIKCVRVDKAKELSPGDTLSFYKEKGIQIQTTCVATPKKMG